METEQSVIVASKWDQLPRKEKRKNVKKLKRKAARKEGAEKERARLNDPLEQQRIELQEKAEAEAAEKARKDFEEHERIWILTHEENELRRQEEIQTQLAQEAAKKEEEENWEYVEDGPAEIIWQGNEIIVQKKRIRVPKGKSDVNIAAEDSNRPISNPLPPQRDAFEAYSKLETPGFKVFDAVEQQIPNFGTEQDKTHCPFHVKTGACRFGARCSRAHFYPEKSCTLLMKNMYNGPGLTWEQEEGLEYTDEEVVHHYEEFYEDVHTEFLKFGELVNFKVCKNGSSHLRGNVYVHYQSLESAVSAYNAINGRFFAAKQVICEFVGVMRWRVAICGEYMKSDRKNCSRGSACNFLHCFRNPGGEYDWADWDSRPPRSWLKKMDMLFGGSRVDQHDHWKLRDLDHWHCYGHSVRRIQSRSSCRSSSRRHESHERDSCSSGEDRGTPVRELSSGRKYIGKGEREQRSGLDQTCATYNRSSCRSSSRRHKSHERDPCSSDEDRGTPVREHLGGRKYYGKEEREQRSDLDQTCATYISGSCRNSSRRRKSNEKYSCSNDEDRGAPIREHSVGRKYNGKEKSEQRSDLDQTCATYRRSSCRSQELYEEQIEVQKEANEDGTLPFEALEKMRKLDSFIRETLRLVDHISGLSHFAMKDYTFSNGLTIPKGYLAEIYFDDVYQDESLQGPNPKSFEPFRHMEKNVPASRIGKNYLPFGGGKHACPGRHFAINEIKFFMHNLILKYNFRTESGKIEGKRKFGPISMPSNARIVFEKRVK